MGNIITMGPVIIETARLRLREWSAEDCADFMRLASNPVVVRFITEGRPYTVAEASQFIRRQLETQSQLGWSRWALELSEPGERDPHGVVGFCGPGCTFAPEVEIGWWLHYDLWGRGLATEAGQAAVDYCFGTIGFDRLICCVHEDNLASRRVAEKVGFLPVGELQFRGLALIKHELRNPLPEPPRDPRFVRDCIVQ